MSLDFERSAAFLDEMGLGPVWVRRAAAPVVQEAVQEEAAHVVTESAAAEAANVEPVTIAPPQSDPAWDEHAAAAPVAEDVPGWVPEEPGPETVPESGPRISEMGWDELEQAVSNCTRCGLCRGRTKTVFGIGDRKARWLFIGEGPGREEDRRGEPFVGRAGQLLDNMLAAIKLARGRNAYIANIVKCRPTDESGKDRRPSPEETAACLPYLKRQIELIQPDVIVALGKTSAVSLLGLDPETPVGGLRGKVHRYGQRPLVVTYHPAYLLRTPADKKKAWADLCLAVAEYEKAGTSERV